LIWYTSFIFPLGVANGMVRGMIGKCALRDISSTICSTPDSRQRRGGALITDGQVRNVRWSNEAALQCVRRALVELSAAAEGAGRVEDPLLVRNGEVLEARGEGDRHVPRA
jgi:hypothetical protein